MLEQLGEEPPEEMAPMDIGDLPENAQYAFLLYNSLNDNIDGMSGTWLGKDFAGLGDIMDIYNIIDKKEVFEFLLVCIDEARKYYEEQEKLRSRMKGGN